jgi:hypothetical protein
MRTNLANHTSPILVFNQVSSSLKEEKLLSGITIE